MVNIAASSVSKRIRGKGGLLEECEERLRCRAWASRASSITLWKLNLLALERNRPHFLCVFLLIYRYERRSCSHPREQPSMEAPKPPSGVFFLPCHIPAIYCHIQAPNSTLPGRLPQLYMHHWRVSTVLPTDKLCPDTHTHTTNLRPTAISHTSQLYM